LFLLSSITRSSPTSLTTCSRARLNKMGKKASPCFNSDFTSNGGDRSPCYRTLQNVFELHILIIFINLFGIPRFINAIHN
jgi:hypothetical protein